MKIDLNKINQEEFKITSSIIAGEECFLVQPDSIKTKFTKENSIFRSSIWNKEGYPVSLSYKKFVDLGVCPEEFPAPTSLKGCEAISKEDGSTLIFSVYKGELITRTRGQFNIDKMANKEEVKVFINKHFEFFNGLRQLETGYHSYIFEWVSPNNIIVLNYPEPEFYLTGIINHENYSYWPQKRLDLFAKYRGFKRPRTYKFNSIEDLIQATKDFKNKEGICLYSNNGQSIHRIKSNDYLLKQKIKQELNNIENVVDLFVSSNYPSYLDFYKQISELVDFETLPTVKGNISKVCDAYKEALNIIDGMTCFVEPLKLIQRKEAASQIMSSYGATARSSFCFVLLNNKKLEGKDIKKLIWQCLKK